jgi:signal transduction histidine kinase
MAGSTPSQVALAAAAMIVVFLAVAHFPPVAVHADFDHVWVSIVLTLAGAALSLTAWRNGCRGPVGATATLLDNACYSSALTFAAVTTDGHISIAFAVLNGLLLISFPARVYGISFLLMAVVVIPILGLFLAFPPEMAVVLIIVSSAIMMGGFADQLTKRREMLGRQRELEQALSAADRVAEESVQAALATTLLTLGHFLHELRNSQAAISGNLEFVLRRSELPKESAAALQDARDTQAQQSELLRSTIAGLKGRAEPKHAAFRLFHTLHRVAEERHEVRVVVIEPDAELQLTGNPEYLRVVLLNLIRNAEQAGARHVTLRAQAEPSGDSVKLLVENDGAAIPEARRERLFDSFVESTTPGGSGLGLYLVRRHVELLGGVISVQPDRSQGAAFVIRLPAQRANEGASGTSVAGAAIELGPSG